MKSKQKHDNDKDDKPATWSPGSGERLSKLLQTLFKKISVYMT